MGTAYFFRSILALVVVITLLYNDTEKPTGGDNATQRDHKICHRKEQAVEKGGPSAKTIWCY